MDREELKAKVAELANKVNELKAEIKVLGELKSPQELKDAVEYSARASSSMAAIFCKRESLFVMVSSSFRQTLPGRNGEPCSRTGPKRSA